MDVVGKGKLTGDKNGRWAGGKYSHELYQVYNEMLARCHRPTHKRYADYGGRGIEVCQAWREDFWTFVEDIGPRPPGKTPGGRALWSLDRIDNDEGYAPGNCRWASPEEQANNKRGFGDGEERRDPETGRYDKRST